MDQQGPRFFRAPRPEKLAMAVGGARPERRRRRIAQAPARLSERASVGERPQPSPSLSADASPRFRAVFRSVFSNNVVSGFLARLFEPRVAARFLVPEFGGEPPGANLGEHFGHRARTPASTIRRPPSVAPSSAVLEIASRMPAIPRSSISSAISFNSPTHSSTATSGEIPPSTSVSNPAMSSSGTPPQTTACSLNRSASASRQGRSDGRPARSRSPGRRRGRFRGRSRLRPDAPPTARSFPYPDW